MLLLVKTQEKQKKYSVTKESNKFANQLDLTQKEIGIIDKAIDATKDKKEKKAKAQSLGQLKNTKEQKPLHGQYPPKSADIY